MQFVDSYIVPCLVYELSIVLSDMEIPEVGATFMHLLVSLRTYNYECLKNNRVLSRLIDYYKRLYTHINSEYDHPQKRLQCSNSVYVHR